MQKNIKFRKIAEIIQREFLKPEWIVGAKIWSEAEVMKRFSVSRMTAKTALQMLEDSGLILCKQGKRSVLIRKPADQSKQRCGLTFALICNDSMGNSYSSDIPWLSVGLQRAFRPWHAAMATFPFLTKADPAELPLIRDLCDRNLADGFFLLHTPDKEDVMAFLEERSIPCVFLNPADTKEMVKDQYNMISMGEEEAVSGFFEVRPYLKKTALFGGENDFCTFRTHFIFSEFAKHHHLDYTVFHTRKMSPADLKRLVLSHANDRETCLVFSTDNLSEINFILSGRKYKAETLVFKHYNPVTEPYEQDYHFVLRPYQKFCEEAAKMMYQLSKERTSGIRSRQNAIYLQSYVTGT